MSTSLRITAHCDGCGATIGEVEARATDAMARNKLQREWGVGVLQYARNWKRTKHYCQICRQAKTGIIEWLADFETMNTPMDAGARRAHFESTKTFNAFHDGADTPEIRAAIARARDKALKAIKARKSAATRRNRNQNIQ